jgi:hypothetical protein
MYHHNLPKDGDHLQIHCIPQHPWVALIAYCTILRGLSLVRDEHAGRIRLIFEVVRGRGRSQAGQIHPNKSPSKHNRAGGRVKFHTSDGRGPLIAFWCLCSIKPVTTAVTQNKEIRSNMRPRTTRYSSACCCRGTTVSQLDLPLLLLVPSTLTSPPKISLGRQPDLSGPSIFPTTFRSPPPWHRVLFLHIRLRHIFLLNCALQMKYFPPAVA